MYDENSKCSVLYLLSEIQTNGRTNKYKTNRHGRLLLNSAELLQPVRMGITWLDREIAAVFFYQVNADNMFDADFSISFDQSS